MNHRAHTTIHTALALLVLSLPSFADAQHDAPSVVRAERQGHDLKLCIHDGGRYDTLTVDPYAPYTSRNWKPECSDFGRGERLDISRSGSGRAHVRVEGDEVVYASDGTSVRIPLDRAVASRHHSARGSHERSASAHQRSRTTSRLERQLEARERNRVPLPGPRTVEIGDAAAATTLETLENGLDPAVEPALAVGLRGTSAVAGVILGAALYVPVTLLDVLASELAVD